jgi:hypothetical protein
MSSHRWRYVLVALAFACVAAPAAAQRQLGAIQGTITDQTGAAVPGVTVTITNKETGEVRTATTNESGIYRILSLDPGRYDIVAELAGFNKAGRNDVILSVGATLGVNLAMTTGGVTETVQVTGTSPDIQTEKAEVSSVIERQRIVDLPIAGRNPLTLATLQPGILGLPGGTDFLAQEQGMVLIVPNTEAVQEFQVVANNVSAEYGRNSGAAISLVTRGGTNELRGSALLFHRNNDMRAKTFFERQKGEFNKNDYGTSLGGPIRRDRSFVLLLLRGRSRGFRVRAAIHG